MSEKTSSVRGRERSTFGVVFLTIFLDMVGFSVIFPLFPHMLDHYLAQDVREGGGLLTNFVNSIRDWGYRSGSSSFRVETVIFGGFLGTLFAGLQFLFAPIWGRWSDRVGRRRVLLVSVGGTCIGYFLWIFAGNFWALVLSRFVGGIASGNLSVATAAIADITPRKERAKGMALVGIAFGLGFILGPAIGGFSVGLNLGDELTSGFFALNPFSVAATGSFALALLNFLWLVLRFRETLPEERRASPCACASIMASTPEAEIAISAISSGPKPVSSVNSFNSSSDFACSIPAAISGCFSMMALTKPLPRIPLMFKRKFISDLGPKAFSMDRLSGPSAPNDGKT